MDNILTSSRSITELVRLAEDLKVHLAEYGFHLKAPDSTTEVLKQLDPAQATIMDNPLEQVMGVIWNKCTDTLEPSWVLNVHPKLKGLHTGPNMSLENLDTLVLPRKIFQRVLASVFNSLGHFSQHIIMA